MAFAQLTYRESLRDIQVCLRATQSRLYHLGIRGKVSRNTLAHANQTRDWRIYANFAQILIEKPENFMPPIRSASNWIKRFMPWIRPPSTSVWPFSLGPSSGNARVQ